MAGPFAFQPNSVTRRFEYPWAYHARPPARGEALLEIGGGLSGFQFALASNGASVLNVDPFVDYGSATKVEDPVARHALLAKTFGRQVSLFRGTIDEAELKTESIDAIYCISTLEHLDDIEIRRTLATCSRVLKPGGRIVLTVDLFLDIDPFSRIARNRFGHNVSILQLCKWAEMELQQGDTSLLMGYPDFDPRHVMEKLPELLIGDYPVVAQLLVLQK